MRKAVILFNMGAPDSLAAVRPFLFNLFYDWRIIRLWNPFRYLLAWYISWRRADHSAGIYKQIGGKSPLLENTQAQAIALCQKLNELRDGDDEYRVFICMRYWHPMADEVVREVKEFDPDLVILLPLYAQYCSSTTLSSIENWQSTARVHGLSCKTKIIEHYFDNEDFIAAHSQLVAKHYHAASKLGQPRVLFSAHGVMMSVIERGDPYAKHVEASARLITEKLAIADLDWRVCYQSKVGRHKWLEPSTKSELRRAAADGVPVVLAPIGFVSEHSETLVELDIDYRPMIEEGFYFRVPALGVDPLFIKCLTGLCREK